MLPSNMALSAERPARHNGPRATARLRMVAMRRLNTTPAWWDKAAAKCEGGVCDVCVARADWVDQADTPRQELPFLVRPRPGRRRNRPHLRGLPSQRSPDLREGF